MSELALNGGKPVTEGLRQQWPQFGAGEQDALKRVLSSGNWGTLGPETDRFASRFAAYQEAAHAIPVSNGTVSLEIILRALAIGREDEVIIPPYTFFSTASSVLLTGAVPVFADIDPGTFNIDPTRIVESITSRTKAIIVVHIGGMSCDMDRIIEIADTYDLFVIEDAAHAHGAEWKGRRLGALGDAGSFSFQKSKSLTSGEGGAITVNDEVLYQTCWSYHNCGRSFDGGSWYGHERAGTNARLTEWQAAILNAQMDRLDGQIEHRRRNAEYLEELLQDLSFLNPRIYSDAITRDTYFLYLFRYASEECRGLTKEQFIRAMKAEGIPLSPGYVCLYRQPAFEMAKIEFLTGRSINYSTVSLPVAEAVSDNIGMWMHLSALMGDRASMEQIVEAARKVYRLADEVSTTDP